MKRSRLSALTAVGIAAALSLTACGSDGNGGGNNTGAENAKDVTPQTVAPAQGAGKTVTVWVMQDDYSQETLDAVNAEFTKQTGAKADIQIQAWDGVETKITTALATSTPPDVLDLGNTQVASFAANGGLKDLTAYAADLRQGQTWLAGLTDPATVDGHLFGVPGMGGVRSVIYNKKTWADAGVTQAPKTYEEMTGALDKVKAKNPGQDFSALYLPGQYWYTGMQFVWDAGGDIAVKGGDKWSAGLSADKAQAGLNDFKAFQNTYSAPASRTVDDKNPDQVQIFADGKASAITASSGLIGKIKKANPQLTDDDLGTFPLPGKSGKTQPVMLGGADWGIAAKAQNADLALQWVKIATSPKIQNEYVAGKEGLIPNSTEGVTTASAAASPLKKSFFDAALNNKATPSSANWSTLESNKDIHNLFAAVAAGSKSPKDAAKAFDEAVNKALNATG